MPAGRTEGPRPGFLCLQVSDVELFYVLGIATFSPIMAGMPFLR